MIRISAGVVVVLLLAYAGYFLFLSPIEEPKAPVASAPTIPLVSFETGKQANLIASREDFAAQEWTKQGVVLTANAGPAPDGSTSAYRLVETQESGAHRIIQTIVKMPKAGSYTLSLYVKPAERTLIGFEMLDSNPTNGHYGTATCDMSQKVADRAKDVTHAGVQQLPGGWFRCWAAMPYATDTAAFDFFLIGTDGATTYPGDPKSGLSIWGVQFEPGDAPKGYSTTAP